MDFQKKLKAIFDKHNIQTKDPEGAAKAIVKTIVQKPEEHTWMVRKRSLPPELNQVVATNLSEKEADEWIRRFHKKDKNGKMRSKPYKFNDNGDAIAWIFYDKSRSDGYLSGIYDNPKELLKAEGADENIIPEFLDDKTIQFFD